MKRIFQGKKWATSISKVLREHRWKFLVVGLVLMILGFKLAFTPIDAQHEFALDYVRDNDWDVMAARSISFICIVLAAIGFKSKFDRSMFPNRFKSRNN